MKNILKELAVLVIVIAIGVAGGLAIWDAFEREECSRWATQAQDPALVDFYITEWQAAQCDAHNIDVPAVVR